MGGGGGGSLFSLVQDSVNIQSITKPHPYNIFYIVCGMGVWYVGEVKVSPTNT